MLRQQCLFRLAAQAIAIALSELPEVQMVAAFGAVAQPLKMEVPCFRQYRRQRIEILHECADLDLAVWLTGLSELKKLKNAMSRGLAVLQDSLFDAGSGAYHGRLCIFGQCPKQDKRECRVPGCGAEPFLQQFYGFRWNSARFDGEHRIILFERAADFLVRPPMIAAEPSDDVPF